MGKIVSVIQFTGRTGNLVGSKGQDGTVVLKNHQPHVTNRNTQEQVNARVKLALAGSLSKIVPADTIYGMTGDGNRGRRQRWIKAIMKRMVVSLEDGITTAKLEPADMILSEGYYCSGITVSNVVVGNSTVTASATLDDKIDHALIVAFFAESRNGGFHSVSSTVVSESGEVSIPLPDDGCHVVNLYSIPIKLATSLNGHSYGNEVIAVGESTSAYSVEAKSYNSGAYVWMHSQYIGSFSS